MFKEHKTYIFLPQLRGHSICTKQITYVKLTHEHSLRLIKTVSVFVQQLVSFISLSAIGHTRTELPSISCISLLQP